PYRLRSEYSRRWAGPAARILTPKARMAPTAQSAPQGERRGPQMLTAGPVPDFQVFTRPARWTGPQSGSPRGGSGPLPSADHERGARRFEAHGADTTEHSAS